MNRFVVAMRWIAYQRFVNKSWANKPARESKTNTHVEQNLQTPVKQNVLVEIFIL
jgi:hypothetical protein